MITYKIEKQVKAGVVRVDGSAVGIKFKRITQLEELVRGKVIFFQKVLLESPNEVPCMSYIFAHQRLHSVKILDYSKGFAQVYFEDGSYVKPEVIFGDPNSPRELELCACWIEE